uniref:Uncharacterized protein n=1 Tax=uncultured marine virus TaxID=186617 RepID=A0A0F7L679_9VIRU|nr:hypothetical protein [uncultured marine virus]
MSFIYIQNPAPLGGTMWTEKARYCSRMTRTLMQKSALFLICLESAPARMKVL